MASGAAAAFCDFGAGVGVATGFAGALTAGLAVFGDSLFEFDTAAITGAVGVAASGFTAVAAGSTAAAAGLSSGGKAAGA